MSFDLCSTPNGTTAREKGKCFSIENSTRKQVTKFQIDGCVINDRRKRCDFLFEIGNPASCAIYVELKGSNVGHAYEQINSTVSFCADRHKKIKDKRAYIVTSKISPSLRSDIQNYKDKLRERHNTTLYIKNKHGKAVV